MMEANSNRCKCRFSQTAGYKKQELVSMVPETSHAPPAWSVRQYFNVSGGTFKVYFEMWDHGLSHAFYQVLVFISYFFASI